MCEALGSTQHCRKKQEERKKEGRRGGGKGGRKEGLTCPFGAHRLHSQPRKKIKCKNPLSAVGHTCNPTGGRDQEDCCSKPAQAIFLQDPILRKTITEKGW
jgi:hypothetical protein